MFTGLIQAVGRIASREDRGGDVRLRVKRGQSEFCEPQQSLLPRNLDAKLHSDPFSLGESIAVSGVCLTVVDCSLNWFDFDVSNETLTCTTLGRLPIGAGVNLECALLATDRLGGHLVSGHVDGLGTLMTIAADARSQRWRIETSPELLRYIASKGSICVDGVSLTVNVADASGFEVNLIPHTIAHTTFAKACVGDAVNLEVDLVARYVERLSTFVIRG